MRDSQPTKSDLRPPMIKVGDAPERDPISGDHVFRFGLEPPPSIGNEELFRWVIEEQLRALLEIVDLADREQVRTLSRYRFKNEDSFRELYPSESHPSRGEEE